MTRKVIRATLTAAVQIGGDLRTSWNAERDDCAMWLDERGHLHIRRRDAYFVTPHYVGAWCEAPVKEKTVASRKPAKAVEPAA